jgi:dolichyl-phosphate-mannose--protein O-mannosyl transferase
MTFWHIMTTLLFLGVGAFAIWSLINDLTTVRDYIDRGHWGDDND